MINTQKLEDIGLDNIYPRKEIDTSYYIKQIKDKIDKKIPEQFRTTKKCLSVLGIKKNIGSGIGIAKDFNCQNFIRFGFICSKKSCEEE